MAFQTDWDEEPEASLNERMGWFGWYEADETLDDLLRREAIEDERADRRMNDERDN